MTDIEVGDLIFIKTKGTDAMWFGFVTDIYFQGLSMRMVYCSAIRGKNKNYAYPYPVGAFYSSNYIWSKDPGEIL